LQSVKYEVQWKALFSSKVKTSTKDEHSIWWWLAVFGPSTGTDFGQPFVSGEADLGLQYGFFSRDLSLETRCLTGEIENGIASEENDEK
jgi:hypothetical protein